MTQVMIDIETLSTQYNAAILSIGAVKWEESEIVDTFYVNVDPKSCKELGLHVEHKTVEWWLKQSAEARKALLNDQKTLTDALKVFRIWYGSKSLPTWGNGAAFDLVIMTHAFRCLGTEPPWKPWEERCYRTMNELVKIPHAPRDGIYHNALDDAVYQTKHLIKILGS